jgi:hypothetical protein
MTSGVKILQGISMMMNSSAKAQIKSIFLMKRVTHIWITSRHWCLC